MRLNEIAYGNPPFDPVLGMVGPLKWLVRPRYEVSRGSDGPAQQSPDQPCPPAFFPGSSLARQLRTRAEVEEETRLMRYDYSLSPWVQIASGYAIVYHVGEPVPAGSTPGVTWEGKEFALSHAGGPTLVHRARPSA